MAERSPRILLVDDEQSIQTLLSYPLRKDGYEVVQAADGREALDALRRAAVRPRRARRDAAEARRARGLPPAAQPQRGADHHADREVGGDRQGRRARDRRRRLHHQAVLDARVPQPREGGAAPRRAVARGRRASGGALEHHELRIDSDKRAVWLRGEPVATTFVEFEILLTLARSPGRVFTRDMLLARVWGDSAYRDPRTIDVHIRHLREKLERDPKEPEYLFTVRGVGYRFRDTDA